MNIALQIERLAAGVVASGANVLFDTIVHSSGNISYNAATGVITFNQPGRYVANWFVATQSSTSTNGAVFAISSSQGDFLVGNSPIKTGGVAGAGILNIAVAPVTASLVNGSTAAYFLAGIVPVKATLVIVQDDPAEPSDGPGAVIPFSSMFQRFASTISDGSSENAVPLGFGSSNRAFTIINNTVTFNQDGLFFGFTVPRDMTITHISGFTTSRELFTQVPDGSLVVPHFQVGAASPAGNVYTLLPGTLLPLLPGYSSFSPIGTPLSADMAVSVPVKARDSIVFVGMIQMTGPNPISFTTELSWGGSIILQ